jgi:hypothetical protein
MEKLQHGTSSLTIAARMQKKKKKKKKKKLKNNPRNESFDRRPSSSVSVATLTQASSSAIGSKGAWIWWEGREMQRERGRDRVQ